VPNRSPLRLKTLYVDTPVRGSLRLAREIQGMTMSNDTSLSLSELNDRIAVLRSNIRQLIEQAAASSGAQDEERTSGRIAQQQEELDKLVQARDALSKK
jgi:uncharacterized small protein (DUF1192 family)